MRCPGTCIRATTFPQPHPATVARNTHESPEATMTAIIARSDTAAEQVDVLLQRVHTIAPILREHAWAAEQNHRLSQESVAAMREAGLYAMFVPKALGGLELDPMSTFQILEEVSRIDAAAGWNLQLSVAIGVLGAWLPDEGAREIFSRDVIVAGTLFPPAQAVAIPGGYRVTGRAPFVSGCHSASWFVGPAQVIEDGALLLQDGNPVTVLVFFPASDAEIIDNWDTLGMRGTGSHDVAITDRFVPDQHTAPFVPYADAPPGSAYQGPLYRLTIWHSIAALAAPALGIAQAAIDDLVALATTKTPAYTATPLAARASAQTQAAQAQAHVGAARAYLYDSLDQAWQTCLGGSVLTREQRMTLQLASCHAVQAAATAVRLVHTAAGGTAIRAGHRFQEYFRNTHTITQHAFVSASRFDAVGQMMFGLDPDWPFFAF